MTTPEEQRAQAEDFVEQYGNQMLVRLGYSGIPPIKFGNQWSWRPADNQSTGEVTVNLQAFGDETYKDEWKLLGFGHEIEAHHAPARLEPAAQAWDARWGREHKAAHIFLNILGDTAGNRKIITKIPESADTWRDFYANKLFPGTDYRTVEDKTGNQRPRPRHMQFLYALIRERFVPDEPCQVDDEVRTALDSLHDLNGSGQDLIAYATQPFKTPREYLSRMEQMTLWREGIWQPYLKLYDKDLEDRKPEPSRQGQSGSNGSPSDTDQSPDSSDDPFAGEYEDYANNRHPGQQHSDDPQSEDSAEQVMNAILNRNPETDKEAEKDENNESAPGSKSDQSDSKTEDSNAQKVGQSEKQRASDIQAAAAKEAGVGLEDYQSYQKEVDLALPYIQDMRRVFEQFISERLAFKRQLVHRQTEGPLIDPENLPYTVAQINSGQTEEMPAFLDYEAKSKEKTMLGKLDFWLVVDTSDSMGWEGGTKAKLAAEGAVTVLEGLDMFNDMVAEESRRQGFDLDFDARSSVITFSSGMPSYEVPKQLGLSLSYQERVEATKGIRQTGGGTDASPALHYINDYYAGDPAMARKKVVVLLTDGEDRNPQGVAGEVKALRNNGVLVYPIYIQSDIVDSAGMRLDNISQLPEELSKRVQESLL